MELKLKTETLKILTTKVIKGMGNNKMLPITEMIGLNIHDNQLSLLSTDGNNNIEVKAIIENPSQVEVKLAVNGDSFSRLIQKTTTEFITLEIDDNKLTVKGNGSYTFALTLDEDNQLVSFDSLSLDSEEELEVDTSTLKESYLLNKESVAVTMEYPAYTGFYYDETGSVATNSLKISYVNNPIFKTPLLLSNSFVQLFSLLDEEKAKVTQNNSEIFISTPSISIKGNKMMELTDFPISDIKPFLNVSMDHKVRVNKQALLNVLERILIFVTPYDKNGIRVDFTKEGLRIWTMKGDNNELLPYSGSENLQDFTIKIDITNFKALVGANPEEEVTIHYGNPNAIKMTFGKVIQIAALQVD